MEIIIDGKSLNALPNRAYRGAGMVSANNSSRLLLDYRAEHPEIYKELLQLMFGKDGIGINHLKIEMGSDVNSSSGTEPAIIRSPDETPDVTRGMGFLLAADAKAVNPELTLDMLYWSEPRWVSDSEDIFDARYRWYKANLDSAYQTLGLKFDYVSANRNERTVEPEWIKYLAKRLRFEKDCPYDYSKIKIAAADEVGTWEAARLMLNDPELMSAVDVVGSHYTSIADGNARLLSDKYGKELWFSEGSAPMGYPEGACRFDGNGTGISGLNGMLDVASRIISMYPYGCMTLYEYQPVISAYYDGVTYCSKQLITANEPWSGHYTLDSGFYMSLHFSRFIKKGWLFSDGACNADGVPGGDGHCIVNSVNTYMTASDPLTGDYSTVLVNSTSDPIDYGFTVRGLDKADSTVYVWETTGPEKNYFRKTNQITPLFSADKSGFCYRLTLKPYSLVTVTTLDIERKDRIWEHIALAKKSESRILSLPYYDNFEYESFPPNYLKKRGCAPRYTTDEGGAFEVRRLNGKNVLMQIITSETKAHEWGYTPDPTSNFGDDRWFNYSMSCDVMLKKSKTPMSSYAGIGIRYSLADIGVSGYSLIVFENGAWKLRRNDTVLREGVITNPSDSHDNSLNGSPDGYSHSIRLTLSAAGGRIVCSADGKELAVYETPVCGEPIASAGRAAFYSSYNENCFANVALLPICTDNRGDKSGYYASRFDNTDSCFEYEGEWQHNTMSSFRHFKRTISTGSEGAILHFRFTGTGFAFCGENKPKNGSAAQIKLFIDGSAASERLTVPPCGFREISVYRDGLERGSHTVSLTVLSGEFSVDEALVI